MHGPRQLKCVRDVTWATTARTRHLRPPLMHETCDADVFKFGWACGLDPGFSTDIHLSPRHLHPSEGPTFDVSTLRSGRSGPGSPPLEAEFSNDTGDPDPSGSGVRDQSLCGMGRRSLRYRERVRRLASLVPEFSIFRERRRLAMTGQWSCIWVAESPCIRTGQLPGSRAGTVTVSQVMMPMNTHA